MAFLDPQWRMVMWAPDGANNVLLQGNSERLPSVRLTSDDSDTLHWLTTTVWLVVTNDGVEHWLYWTKSNLIESIAHTTNWNFHNWNGIIISGPLKKNHHLFQTSLYAINYGKFPLSRLQSSRGMLRFWPIWCKYLMQTNQAHFETGKDKWTGSLV